MDGFITWNNLLDYATFVSILYMVVEFTKNLAFVKKIPTKYWCWIVSFVMILITNLATNNFQLKDIMLYMISSVAISLGANGLSDFQKKVVKDNGTGSNE